MYEDDESPAAKYEARLLFQEAYDAQLGHNYEEAIELYKRSIEVYPTAEAHTFLGWVFSFQNRYDEAIAECLEAIRVDETLGNPYNDIGSYLLAKGDSYGCVRWFKRALFAPRYESYAFPHFNRWQKATRMVVFAGSSERCLRRVTSHMPFRISIWVASLRCVGNTWKRQDITP